MSVGRYAVRGIVAAMAMTGMRKVSTGLGILEDTPPDKIAKETPLLAPLLERVPAEYHEEVIELAHWAYGAVGGVVFGLVVPKGLQTRRTGVAYGLATWAFFETGLVPLLGLSHAQQNEVASRVAVALDHVMYGVLVAGEH